MQGGRCGKAAALGTKSLVAYFARAGEVQLRKANKRKVGRPQKEAARIRKGSTGPRANCWSDVRLSEFRNGGVHARVFRLSILVPEVSLHYETQAALSWAQHYRP